MLDWLERIERRVLNGSRAAMVVLMLVLAIMVVWNLPSAIMLTSASPDIVFEDGADVYEFRPPDEDSSDSGSTSSNVVREIDAMVEKYRVYEDEINEVALAVRPLIEALDARYSVSTMRDYTYRRVDDMRESIEDALDGSGNLEQHMDAAVSGMVAYIHDFVAYHGGTIGLDVSSGAGVTTGDVTDEMMDRAEEALARPLAEYALGVEREIRALALAVEMAKLDAETDRTAGLGVAIRTGIYAGVLVVCLLVLLAFRIDTRNRSRVDAA